MVADVLGHQWQTEIGTMRVTIKLTRLIPYQHARCSILWHRAFSWYDLSAIFVIIGDIIGVFGGYIVGVYRLGSMPPYTSVVQCSGTINVMLGVIKVDVVA